MGARKLTYSKEVSPKLKLISRRDTANFSKNASKISLFYYPACPDNLGFGMLACPVHTGLPNRHEAGNEYRYGYQGSEKDDEVKGEGNSINYKYRMHDPRVGRFFAVDPLTSKYPHNSPYAFSENRVIDGVELEGLEYATIVYRIDDGGSPVFVKIDWHDNEQYNLYDEYTGIAIRVEYFKNGKLGHTVTSNHKRNKYLSSFIQNFTYYDLQDYGFYYGPTTLTDVNKVFNYEIPGIDAVDEAARKHDMGYDLFNATAQNGATHLGTIEADLKLIRDAKIVRDLGIGGVDPFTKQRITLNEWAAADNAILYFEGLVWKKKVLAANFMKQNYKDEAKDVYNWYGGVIKENVEYNYNLFYQKYFIWNGEDGLIHPKEGMWSDDLSTPLVK